jgi:hypothetical protein
MDVVLVQKGDKVWAPECDLAVGPLGCSDAEEKREEGFGWVAKEEERTDTGWKGRGRRNISLGTYLQGRCTFCGAKSGGWFPLRRSGMKQSWRMRHVSKVIMNCKASSV